MVGRAVALGLTVLVAALDLGFYAVMGAAAGGALATLVVTWLLSRGWCPIRFLRRPRGLAAAAGGQRPAGAGAGHQRALLPRRHADHLAATSPTTRSGLYTLAYRILEFTLALGTIFLTTVVPGACRATSPTTSRARCATIQAAWDLFVDPRRCRWWPAARAGPAVIELVGGADFDEAAEPLRILLVAGALSWVNGVFGFALIAKERQASALWLNVTALELQRRPELRAGAALRHSGGGHRDRGLRGR